MSEIKTNEYPVTFTFDPPERIARWRPLVHWLLAIPHLFILEVLGFVAGVVVVISWFAGVFTGNVPQGLQQVNAMQQRYSLRVMSYVLFLREEYPPFAFTASLADDGADPRVRIDYTPTTGGRNRLTIFFRGILIIPQAIVIGLLGIALYVVIFIGFFAVLFTGRWPEGLRNFVIGFLRWNARFSAYAYLLNDTYPPFSLE